VRANVHDDLAARQRALDALVDELLLSANWPGPKPPITVDPNLPAHLRARCTIRRGRERIRIHPRVFDEPYDVQRGTAAHEIAHLVEGRATGWPIALLLTVGLWSTAIVAIATGLLGHDLAGQWRGMLAGITLGGIAWRVAVIPQRRCERRADAYSTTLVGRDVVIRTLRHLQAETPRYVRAVATLGLDSHPSPAQRLRSLPTDSSASRRF
jgi:Zn-dependent protease with chaperone function